MSQTTDNFIDGTRSITAVLRPKGSGWEEIPGANKFTLGFPARSYFHRRSNLFVISAVETVSDGKIDKGPEYHISISKPVAPGVSARCDGNDAKWVLDQFGMDGAEEDNHVPGGKVRNFWRPVASRLIGLECECKGDEPAIIEDKGDFIWRPVQ